MLTYVAFDACSFLNITLESLEGFLTSVQVTIMIMPSCTCMFEEISPSMVAEESLEQWWLPQSTYCSTCPAIITRHRQLLKMCVLPHVTQLDMCTLPVQNRREFMTITLRTILTVAKTLLGRYCQDSRSKLGSGSSFTCFVSTYSTTCTDCVEIRGNQSMALPVEAIILWTYIHRWWWTIESMHNWYALYLIAPHCPHQSVCP